MAREGYLLHAGEETINSGDISKLPQTPKKKWQNFWFYHKTHVIVGIILAAAAAFFIYDMVNRESPDYNIGIITERTIYNPALEEMSAKLAEYGEDLNGDGKVLIQLNAYAVQTPLPEEESGVSAANGVSSASASVASDPSAPIMMADPNIQMANVVKLSGDFQNMDSVIFLTDEISFQNYSKEGAFGEIGKDALRVPMDDFELLRQFEDPAVGITELSVSLRSPSGKEKDQAYYDASVRFYEKLKNG